MKDDKNDVNDIKDADNVNDTEELEDENEKVDEDIAEVGGNLKKSVPYLLGGLFTVAVIIAVIFVIVFCAGNKKTDDGGDGTVGTSEIEASGSVQTSDNDISLIYVSGNDGESANAGDTETEDSSGTTEPGDEGLVSGDTTSSSLTTLSRDFLDSADYEDVTDLIGKYFVAYAACDINELLSLVDYNGGTQITQTELDERAEIVKDYQNLECYIIEGMDASSYVVYASYGIKFYNIDTLAPTLTRFYVTTSEDGSLHIYNGEVTSKLNAYLNSVNEYDCVNELSESINTALGEACEVDETLRTLMEILYGSETTTEGE